MIIFDILWLLVKIWFFIFTMFGAIGGFCIGIGVIFIAGGFTWELAVDKVNQQLGIRRLKKVVAKGHTIKRLSEPERGNKTEGRYKG